jgi:hypothetical protein
MAIAGGIGITIIILIVLLYNNQEAEIAIINEPIEIELGNDVSEVPEIQKKIDDIVKKANENYYEPPPREWQTSGPFQIDRFKYLIGEKIFLVIGDLGLDEKGQIAFLRPMNMTHVAVWQTISFDGTKKPAFNFYTQPVLSQALKICTVDDLIGEWTVVFRGTDYPNLKFKIINEILPGDEESYVPIC